MTPLIKNVLVAAFVLIGGGAALLINLGFFDPEQYREPSSDQYLSPDKILFRDDVEKSNSAEPTGLSDLDFVDSTGQPVALSKYRGENHVVLVVMRGFPGFVCPGCTAQTSRLLKNVDEFTRRQAQVLVVFPGSPDRVPAFVDAVKTFAGAAPPFPILLDADFQLVDRLGIRGTQAKPSTYIVDRDGTVRFAYVGASTADRPSLKALLGQLDQINGAPPADATTFPAGL